MKHYRPAFNGLAIGAWMYVGIKLLAGYPINPALMEWVGVCTLLAVYAWLSEDLGVW